MPTFAASTPTILRHPDGQMVALEPGEVLAADDPLVVAYPHLFDGVIPEFVEGGVVASGLDVRLDAGEVIKPLTDGSA